MDLKARGALHHKEDAEDLGEVTKLMLRMTAPRNGSWWLAHAPCVEAFVLSLLADGIVAAVLRLTERDLAKRLGAHAIARSLRPAGYLHCLITALKSAVSGIEGNLELSFKIGTGRSGDHGSCG